MDTIQNPEYFKGRGAQVNTHNKFAAQRYVAEHIEGLDEEFLENSNTQLIDENPKKIISVNDSPDLRMGYSLNPYQGCEHGCIYCYAQIARHTSELQSLMRIPYAVFCLNIKTKHTLLTTTPLSHPD